MHKTGFLRDVALRAHAAITFALLGVLAGGIAPAPAAERFEHGLLWRIDGKSAPASHVFGTIHLADPRVTALPRAVAKELNRARSLTIEVRLDPGTILVLAKRMIYDDGRDLHNYERMPPLIARLVEAYLARDLAGLWRISEESGGEGAAAKRLRAVFAHRLLEERNVRMAERSEARLREGGAFIAVGALHLYGDAGMLSLLERRGWRVTRVY